MSMRARKERIQDLHFRILDKCSTPTEEDKTALPHKIMKEICAKFSLEHGLSRKTINEYLEVLKTFEILSNNFDEIWIDYRGYTWDEGKKTESLANDVLTWYVNTKKKLPYWNK